MGKPLSRPDCLRRGRRGSRCLGKRQGEDAGIEDCYIPQRSIYDTVRINEQIDQGSASSTLGSAGGEGSTLSTNGTLGAGGTSRPGSSRKLDERHIFDALKLSAEPGHRSPGEGAASVSPGASSSSSVIGCAKRSTGVERNDSTRRSWKTFLPPESVEEKEARPLLGPTTPVSATSPSACVPPASASSPVLISFSGGRTSSTPSPTMSSTSQAKNRAPLSLQRPLSASSSSRLPLSLSLRLSPVLLAPPPSVLDAGAEGDSPGAAESEADNVPLLTSPVPLMTAHCPSSTERTWPRRLLGRRRTVSQGGVLHNFPVLPPLPPLLADYSSTSESACLLGPASPFPMGISSVAGELRLGEREWRTLQQLQEEEEEEGSEGVREPDECGWEAVLRQVNSLWEPGSGAAELQGWDLQQMGSLSRWPLLRPPAGFGGSQPPSGPGSELGSDDLELEVLTLEADEERGEGLRLTGNEQASEGHGDGESLGTKQGLELSPAEKGQTEQRGLPHRGPERTGEQESDSRLSHMPSTDKPSRLVAVTSENGAELSTQTYRTAKAQIHQTEEALSDRRDDRKDISMETHDVGDQPIIQEEGCEAEEKGKLAEDEEKKEVKLEEARQQEATSEVQESRSQNSQAGVPCEGTELPLPLSPSKHDTHTSLLEVKADAFVATDSFVYLAVSALPPFPQDIKPPSQDGSEPPSPGGLPAPWPEESDFLSTDSFVYLAAPERLPLAPGESSTCETSQGSSSEDSRSGVDFVLGSMTGDSDWDSDGSGSEPATDCPSWDFWEELEPSIFQELFRGDELELEEEEESGLHDCKTTVEQEDPEVDPSEHLRKGESPTKSCFQVLMGQFQETVAEMEQWLDEMERVQTQLSQPATEPKTLRKQQDELRLLRECVSEHQAHTEKLQLIVQQLADLSDHEGETVRQCYRSIEQRYRAIREKVKCHGEALQEAILQFSQFHEKMESLLETLERAVHRLRQRHPVAVEVDKIQEQLAVHRAAGWEIEKLLPSYSALCSQGEELAALESLANPGTEMVQLRVQRLQALWEEIRQRKEEREAQLLNALSLAVAFWTEAEQVHDVLTDAQLMVTELEVPEVDPLLIKHQVEVTESARMGVDQLWERLGSLRTMGADLISACGETDRQQVVKTMEEINTVWDRLSRICVERKERLEEALMTSLQYQHALQGMFEYMDSAVMELNEMSAVVIELSTVTQHVEELKLYRTGVSQQHITMEMLSHQGAELLKKTSDPTERNKIQEPLSVLRDLWDHLGTKLIQREHQLQGALLALGQFKYALSELQSWLCQCHASLEMEQPISCDTRHIQMELAKHHVLRKELLSRGSTVESISTAGWELTGSGEQVSHVQEQLEALSHNWDGLLLKVQAQQKVLEAALLKSEQFHAELEEAVQWLTVTERQLAEAMPTGGLPEAAREQLQCHMTIQDQLVQRVDQFHQLLDQREILLLAHSEEGEGGFSITQTLQKLTLLQNKWSSLSTRMEEKKLKLEQVITMGTVFQASLQVCINWLIQAEQVLNMAQPPSLILDTVLLQIAQHQEFMTGVNSHRDLVLALEKAGSQLSSISLEQDVVLIRSLLFRVHSRWDQLVESSLDRDQCLEKARITAELFKRAWLQLWDWLQEAESRLDTDLDITNELEQICVLLAEHKEFQKLLCSKRPMFYTTVRFCRDIREKAILPADTLNLGNLLGKIRDKWDYVCGRSMDRQQHLEQALLQAGHTDVALQVMVDWLLQVEPQLNEQESVHGDLGLVAHLVDSHKVLQQELGKRAGSIEVLKCSAAEMMDKGHTMYNLVQLEDLSKRWDRICTLSINKQLRLQQALKQAEEFRSAVQRLRAWFSGLEQSLRYHSVLPEEAEPLHALLTNQRDLLKMVQEKGVDVDRAVSLGEAILSLCHPDGITSITQGITSLQELFQEVLTWTRQHEQRLERSLEQLQNSTMQLQDLQSWLLWAESNLAQREAGPLPHIGPQLRELITEHQAFMEEVKQKQAAVDWISKEYRRKSAGCSNSADRLKTCEECCSQWQQVWQSANTYQHKLNDVLYRLEELKESECFDFNGWRERYVIWLRVRKAGVMDAFHCVDRDQDGRITRLEFTEGIMASNFPTSQQELMTVADIFDQDGDGHIDYYQFVAALLSSRDEYHLTSDSVSIENEVFRQVVQCRCAKRFQVEKVGQNIYKFWDSECPVRMLFGLVLVQLGSGWVDLDRFLLKYDPCRASGSTTCVGRRHSRKRMGDV